MTTYSFRDSFGTFNDKAITPQIAGEELERIREEHGTLSAPIVVDEARPEEAPLHPAFEWDDAVAGEKYRVHQARNLIKTVQVISGNNKENKPHSVYVNINSKESAYEPIGKVVESPDLFEIAFSQACARLASAERSLEELRQAALEQNRPETKRYQDAASLVKRAQAVMVKG